MSPEQASADRDLSARSDVYSLGCVLYEMLAGQPPHTGPSAQNILVRILTEDPRDVAELRRTVPPHVAATVMKSIEKLPADRFDTARQFMDALEDPNFSHVHVSRAVTTPSPAPAAGTPSAAAPAKLVRGMAGALVVLVGLAAWGWLRPAPDVPSPMATRASIDLRGDEVHQFAKLIISPDGSHLAYVSGNEGDRRLWVRRIDEEHFRVLYQGDAFWPAFSPDGDWIAFEQGDALMKVALSGGAPRVVAPERSQVGQPHWGDDRTIVFWDTGRIYRVPETGGEPTLVAELSGESLANPHLLPGGRGLLASSGSSFTTYFVDLERDTIVPLIPGGITARYVDTGHVLYLDEEGGLWARAFDPTSGEVTGEATPVLQGIGLRSNLVGRYDVSRTGTLVYGLGGVTAMAAAPGELVVVGLDGSEEVAPLPPRVIRQVRWAPDGERIAYAGTEPGDLNASWMIYEYNVELQTTPTRLTSEGDVNNYPAWSPDGERIAFSSAREGSVGRDLYVKNVFDDSPPERIFGVNGRSRPDDWLEGDVLVFTTGNSAARNNSWTIQIPDSATAQPYVAAEGNRQWSRVAPQGDLAAYESNETGRYEIFVRAFPEARQPTPVSSGGGLRPRWSPDGNTIYYWREYQGGDSLFAARIQREPAFRVLSTDVVLAGDYRSPDDWDLHPDGDRFVTTRLVETGSATSAAAGIEPERHLMVTNWFTELLAAVGEGN
jgi:serine/threonine-protein kinase